jgi:hypothetical protein
VTTRQVIAAIRRQHLRANIAPCERNPRQWGRPEWARAVVDPGRTIFGPGPYLHVPIRGGELDGMWIRVYPPERLRRQLAAAWRPLR